MVLERDCQLDIDILIVAQIHRLVLFSFLDRELNILVKTNVNNKKSTS